MPQNGSLQALMPLCTCPLSHARHFKDFSSVLGHALRLQAKEGGGEAEQDFGPESARSFGPESARSTGPGALAATELPRGDSMHLFSPSK